MKSFFICVCITLFTCTVNSSFSQSSNESFYVFNEDWSPAASIDKCTYFMHEIKKSDTEYVCRYYNKLGPMIKQEVYKDSALSVSNGFFCWYNKNGKLDSSGYVSNFKKDGRWDYYLGDSLQVTYYDEYDTGKFIKRNSYHLMKDTSSKHDSDITQKEATYKNNWSKYLQKNLRTPDRFMNIFPKGIYTATVCFTISKEGNVIDVYLVQSLEWSADAELFKIIENSPNWEPAIQKGKPVLYRQKENISFSIN
jgi:hypothetical protein